MLPSHFAPVRGSGSGFVRVRLGFVCWAGLGWGICTGFGLSVSAGAGGCLSADLRRGCWGIFAGGIFAPLPGFVCREGASQVWLQFGYKIENTL